MTLAIVYVNCIPEGQDSAQMHVRKVDGVIESYTTSGAYDMILKVKAETESELRDIIRNVKKISGIGSAITSIVLDGHEKTD
jgi:DNA-binding Lrp family transcriptional regulator